MLDRGGADHGHGSVEHDHGVDAHAAPPRAGRALRIGIGGPVGSGKTALVAALCRALRDGLALGVVTNDIYTTEDADFLRRAGVLDPTSGSGGADRLLPAHRDPRRHRANLDAVEELEAASARSIWCWSRAAATT